MPESREQDFAVRLAVLEARWDSDKTALDVRTAYLEKRLADLNGEAGRLKSQAEASVSREKFDDFVNSSRQSLEAYRNAQAAAFKAYADDIEKRMSAINVKLATWGGGLIAAGAIVQYLLRKV
jgi:hypothetical protein